MSSGAAIALFFALCAMLGGLSAACFVVGLKVNS